MSTKLKSIYGGISGGLSGGLAGFGNFGNAYPASEIPSNARGHGEATLGGWAAELDPVYLTVTNLNDSGTGSLREAINNANPRVIKFDASLTGELALVFNLDVTDPYCTLLGNGSTVFITANGQSLGGTVNISANQVFFQNIRIRAGEPTTPSASVNDPLRIDNDADNVYLQNLSLQQANDETLAISSGTNITADLCLFNHALVVPTPDEPYGVINYSESYSQLECIISAAKRGGPNTFRGQGLEVYNNWIMDSGYKVQPDPDPAKNGGEDITLNVCGNVSTRGSTNLGSYLVRSGNHDRAPLTITLYHADNIMDPVTYGVVDPSPACEIIISGTKIPSPAATWKDPATYDLPADLRARAGARPLDDYDTVVMAAYAVGASGDTYNRNQSRWPKWAMREHTWKHQVEIDNPLGGATSFSIRCEFGGFKPTGNDNRWLVRSYEGSDGTYSFILGVMGTGELRLYVSWGGTSITRAYWTTTSTGFETGGLFYVECDVVLDGMSSTCVMTVNGSVEAGAWTDLHADCTSVFSTSTTRLFADNSGIEHRTMSGLEFVKDGVLVAAYPLRGDYLDTVGTAHGTLSTGSTARWKLFDNETTGEQYLFSPGYPVPDSDGVTILDGGPHGLNALASNSYCLEFDGAADYVDFKKITLTGLTTLRLQASIVSTAAVSDQSYTIISQHETADVGFSLSLINGQIRWVHSDDGTTLSDWRSTAATFNDGEPHVIDITFTAATAGIVLTVDGESELGSWAAGPDVGLFDSAASLEIGGLNVGEQLFLGNIFNVHLHVDGTELHHWPFAGDLTDKVGG